MLINFNLFYCFVGIAVWSNGCGCEDNNRNRNFVEAAELHEQCLHKRFNKSKATKLHICSCFTARECFAVMTWLSPVQQQQRWQQHHGSTPPPLLGAAAYSCLSKIHHCHLSLMGALLSEVLDHRHWSEALWESAWLREYLYKLKCNHLKSPAAQT